MMQSLFNRSFCPRRFRYTKVKKDDDLCPSVYLTPESFAMDELGDDCAKDVDEEGRIRVKEIKIKRSSGAIDQIKFVYSDDSDLVIGHNGGKEDNCPVIFTKGEYLVRVTHEKFFNKLYAGAGIELETNKGRLFSYLPHRSSTKWTSELTTMEANPGHEISALKIKKGILVGIEQQPLPAAEREIFFHERKLKKKKRSWFAVATLEPTPSVRSFQGKKEAERFFFNKKDSGFSAVILLDCIKNAVVKQCGAKDSISKCLDFARAEGYHRNKPEDMRSLLDSIILLFKVLHEKQDVMNFIVITSFLAISFYLNLYGSILTGQVLTSVSTGTIEEKERLWFTSFINRMLFGGVMTGHELRKSILASFVIVQLLDRFFYVSQVYIHHLACATKNVNMKGRAFAHVLGLDQSFFDKKSMSSIRGSMNVEAINNMITWNVPYTFTLVLKLTMSFMFMFSINVRLATICLIFYVLMQRGILQPMGQYERNVNTIQRKFNIVNQQTVDETFDMISSVKLFSREQHHLQELRECEQEWFKLSKYPVILRCIREFSCGIMNAVIFGTVLYQSFSLFEDGTLSAGQITSFYLLFQEVNSLVDRIKWHYELLLRDLPDAERFIALMKQNSTIKNGTEKPTSVSGHIEFKDVTFEYPSRPGQPILQKLDLELKPNKITAIVGDSGAGKSTITKLLMRLYDPVNGDITLDGVSIKDLEIKHFHDQIAIVNQNPDLYNTTIFENIAYGAVGPVTKREVEEAAKLANCYEFINAFKGKFDTFAGARGTQLSGGQKQRIAIARAAIRDPKILILDEATSSLDAENEAEVQDALEKVMKGKSILIIAHRLSTIKNADEIVVMKKGRVVEKGTHEDLMALKGSYHSLIEHQIVKS